MLNKENTFDKDSNLPDGRVTGLLIAAGLSSRMGSNKALLPYNGVPFAAVITARLLTACDKVIVVLGHQAAEVRAAITAHTSKEAVITFVENSQYMLGMFTSLQQGLNQADTEWLLYHFTDQPGLADSFYEQFLLQRGPGKEWIQPVYSGRKGHPILIHSSVFPSILQAPPDSNLRACLQQYNIKRHLWECATPAIFQDIDTPEAYQQQIGK